MCCLPLTAACTCCAGAHPVTTGLPQLQRPPADSKYSAFRQPAPRQGPEGLRPSAAPGTAGAAAAHAAAPQMTLPSAGCTTPMQQPPGAGPSPAAAAAAAALQGAPQSTPVPALVMGIPLPQLQPHSPQLQPQSRQPHASGGDRACSCSPPPQQLPPPAAPPPCSSMPPPSPRTPRRLTSPKHVDSAERRGRAAADGKRAAVDGHSRCGHRPRRAGRPCLKLPCLKLQSAISGRPGWHKWQTWSTSHCCCCLQLPLQSRPPPYQRVPPPRLTTEPCCSATC